MNTDEALTVHPTYGRDYETHEEVLTAFEDNNDFKIILKIGGGPYVNKFDLRHEPEGYLVRVRFKQLTKLVLLRKQADGSWQMDG